MQIPGSRFVQLHTKRGNLKQVMRAVLAWWNNGNQLKWILFSMHDRKLCLLQPRNDNWLNETRMLNDWIWCNLKSHGGSERMLKQMSVRAITYEIESIVQQFFRTRMQPHKMGWDGMIEENGMRSSKRCKEGRSWILECKRQIDSTALNYCSDIVKVAELAEFLRPCVKWIVRNEITLVF